MARSIGDKFKADIVARKKRDERVGQIDIFHPFVRSDIIDLAHHASRDQGQDCAGKILDMSDVIRAFITDNNAALKDKV